MKAHTHTGAAAAVVAGRPADGSRSCWQSRDFICLEFLHCVISWAQGPDVAAVVAGRPADGAGAGGQAGLLARFSSSSVSYQRGGSLVQGPTAAAVVAGWAADGAGAAGRSGATRAAD